MSEPSDTSRLLLTVLYAVWIAAFLLSFYVFATSEAASRVVLFLGWQGVAGTVGFAIFGVTRSWPKGSGVRRLGGMPLGLAALVALGLGGISFY